MVSCTVLCWGDFCPDSKRLTRTGTGLQTSLSGITCHCMPGLTAQDARYNDSATIKTILLCNLSGCMHIWSLSLTCKVCSRRKCNLFVSSSGRISQQQSLPMLPHKCLVRQKPVWKRTHVRNIFEWSFLLVQTPAQPCWSSTVWWMQTGDYCHSSFVMPSK